MFRFGIKKKSTLPLGNLSMLPIGFKIPWSEIELDVARLYACVCAWVCASGCGCVHACMYACAHTCIGYLLG